MAPRAGAIPVPEVLAVSDDAPNHLVLEWIDEGPTRSDTEARARRRARRAAPRRRARVRAGGPAHHRQSRPPERARARRGPSSTARNGCCRSRASPGDGGALPDAAIDALERLAGDLERFDTGEPPARLHGDLWAGNRLVDARGRSWLIDPAAHGGHREFDLAMMRLFGGFGPDCFAAYEPTFPLADGWEERVPLHQIAPLVVHAIKFGGGYVRASVAAIDRCT